MPAKSKSIPSALAMLLLKIHMIEQVAYADNDNNHHNRVHGIRAADRLCIAWPARVIPYLRNGRSDEIGRIEALRRDASRPALAPHHARHCRITRHDASFMPHEGARNAAPTL